MVDADTAWLEVRSNSATNARCDKPLPPPVLRPKSKDELWPTPRVTARLRRTADAYRRLPHVPTRSQRRSNPSMPTPLPENSRIGSASPRACRCRRPTTIWRRRRRRGCCAVAFKLVHPTTPAPSWPEGSTGPSPRSDPASNSDPASLVVFQLRPNGRLLFLLRTCPLPLLVNKGERAWRSARASPPLATGLSTAARCTPKHHSVAFQGAALARRGRGERTRRRGRAPGRHPPPAEFQNGLRLAPEGMNFAELKESLEAGLWR
jgi:hypothetical protein